ncbi:MAG: hypothetical protein LBH05_05295 [Deferribacteraceae bacterium]|jgi:hypothetical protein|nr:hypothetical protein [Deferribacteraceae bacterium]
MNNDNFPFILSLILFLVRGVLLLFYFVLFMLMLCPVETIKTVYMDNNSYVKESYVLEKYKYGCYNECYKVRLSLSSHSGGDSYIISRMKKIYDIYKADDKVFMLAEDKDGNLVNKHLWGSRFRDEKNKLRYENSISYDINGNSGLESYWLPKECQYK